MSHVVPRFHSTPSQGLFRRGVARSRSGYLDEARADLLLASRLDPTNVQVRKELVIVKEKEAEVQARNKKVRLRVLSVRPFSRVLRMVS